jgi:hypothetical protein
MGEEPHPHAPTKPFQGSFQQIRNGPADREGMTDVEELGIQHRGQNAVSSYHQVFRYLLKYKMKDDPTA